MVQGRARPTYYIFKLLLPKIGIFGPYIAVFGPQMGIIGNDGLTVRKAVVQLRPKKASIFKEPHFPHAFEKDISFINRSFFNIRLVQQPDKIVACFALTIYPYSL
jgi:hypothetical protein